MKNDLLSSNTHWKGLPARRALMLIVNICRAINQVYHSELEYEINQHKSIHENDLAQLALQLAINEMKKVAEEAETVYNK
ncbi:unnamed protein product [Adineta steineri]|uniref:Uncharacterized protein n=1 Tax=Adineta steineri TaxID=433720 RepID=A0A816DV86_9BILA|nr:unnamed protein product [Adineta steineri]CAF1638656.1 unnamed protein product [Adineta steineri]